MTSSKNAALTLHPGKVDIWLTSVSSVSDSLRQTYQRLLSESERARWQRFVVEGVRHEYLIARALIRTTLSRYVDVPEEVWEFETNPYGRPYISRPYPFRDIQFNLSHSNGIVACAVAKNCDIGIDVEWVRRDIDFILLAPMVFAPVEVFNVLERPPQDRCHYFFSYWTLKEAYIKARGMGLSLALDAFWFDLAGLSPRIHFSERCPDDPNRWRFWQYSPTVEHKLAVAVSTSHGYEVDIRLRWVTPLLTAADPE